MSVKHISPKNYPDLLEHPTLMTIDKIFNDFKPDIVVVEGINTGGELSPNTLLGQADKCKKSKYRSGCGESFFAINKARETGATFVSGEPLENLIHRKFLKNGYKTEDLLSFYLIREIPVLKRRSKFKKSSFKKLAESKLARFKKEINIDSNFNFNDFENWYSNHMASPRSYMDIKNMDAAPHGGEKSTYVQRISNIVTLIRDRGIVSRIEDMLRKFNKVFVVYGGSHFITQEKVLNQALGKPTYKKIY